MSVYNRYKKLRKAIKYADGTIVYVEPAEYKKGELISQESFETLEDCMYIYQYRWNKVEVVESDKNTYICEGFSQYYKEVYQKSLDNVHWVDVEPKQERKGELIKENSESCGYIKPIYEWRLIPIDLGNPNTYICYEGDVYTIEKEYVSYDNGLSYEPTGSYRKAELYMTDVEFCIENIVYSMDDTQLDVVINHSVNLYTKVFNPDEWEKANPGIEITSLAFYSTHENPNINIAFNKFKPNANYIKFYGSFNSFNAMNQFDTSSITDMTEMFNGCDKITSLDLSNFDTSKVTSMYYMFSLCLFLKTLDLSSFDTSNVTNMYCMFDNCHALKSVDLSNFNTSKVTDMSAMFNGCKKLISLDLSSFDTSNVTNMHQMFSGCKILKSLDLSNFNTSNVVLMHDMFSDCTGLTSLDLSKFDTSKVTSMSYMFSGCDNLNYIKCKQAFRDWCWKNKNEIYLPTQMREGGSGRWEIVG